METLGSEDVQLANRSEAEIGETRRRFRAQMPVCEKWTYLDHASVAPLPGPSHSAIRNWVDQASFDGNLAWPQWRATCEQARRHAAQLLAATEQEIALVQNTSAGISAIAEGFPWQAGDNIVTLANEFPSNIYPWMNLAERGVETRLVPVPTGIPDLQTLREACDEKTRIVSVSWVGYATGWRIDVPAVAEIAHACGAYLMLDAIQGLGVFPLDVRAAGIDFLAADGHKWLLGPEAAGILYIRQELLEQLRPVGVGWNSVTHPYAFHRVAWQPKPSAARYEGGSQNMVGFVGLSHSLGMLRDLGLSHQASPIADAVLDFRENAMQRLQAAGASIVSPGAAEPNASGILVWTLPNLAPETLRNELHKQRIVVSCRGGGVRISFHGYNDRRDLDHLVDTVTRLLAHT